MIALDTQLNIISYSKQGMSCREIARKTGRDPRTVKRYLDHPELINQKRKSPPRGSKLDPYRARIASLLNDDLGLHASVIYHKLTRDGYTGSYELVKRCVHAIKTENTRVAYIRFETEPAQQAQVDFGEFMVKMPDGTVKKYYLFAMILGYSRKLYCELLERCEMLSFLEAHMRAFEYFGGVPYEILYDRMRNVFIGRVAGKDKFTESLVRLATHYGFNPKVAPAYAPWVKGKIERPMEFVREGWWRGYEFRNLASANTDLTDWLAEKSQRVHGTTHERIDTRFEREKPQLLSLPPTPCDISLRLFRTVNKDCTISVNCNSYVVDHKLVGKKVLVRMHHSQLRIFDDTKLVVTYSAPEGRGNLVQDPCFYAALKADHELQARKFHASNSKTPFAHKAKGRAVKATISPAKGPAAVDVTTYEQQHGITTVEAVPLPTLSVQSRPISEYARAVEGVRYAG
jgi:transposase